MKKTVVKIGALIGEMALSYGAGYAYGKLLNFIFSHWITEENAEEHPWLVLGMIILEIALLIAFAAAWTLYPMTMIANWINDKIDDHFDEKDDFEE